jgi:hypothetical protein
MKFMDGVLCGLLCGAPALRAEMAARMLAPTNDAFTNSSVITGLSGATSGDNTDATVEPSEKVYGFGSNTAWWSWTAPVQGWYAFDTVGSAFDTVIGVWQGTAVSNLTLVITNNNEIGQSSLAAFVATTNKPYRVQVYGVDNTQMGAIALRWSPLVMLSQFSVTSEWSDVWLDRSGYALSQPATKITTQTTWMNAYGNVFLRTTSSMPTPTTATLENLYGVTVFTAQAFQKPPSSARIAHYDIAAVLLRGTATPGIKLTVNGFAASGFSAGNSLTVVSNFHMVTVVDRSIYVTLTNKTSTGLLYCNYALVQPVWELPAAPGAFSALYHNGVTIRTNAGAATLDCAVFKKTRQKGLVAIPKPATGTLNLRSNDRGSILFWTATLGTNGPLTLVNRRGMPIFSAFQPAGFETFSQCLFDTTRLAFVTGATGQVAQLALYMPRRVPQLKGTLAIPDFHSIGLDKYGFYSVSSVTGITTVCGYNNILKKRWTQTAAGSFYRNLGKTTYALLTSTATNDVYTIYKAGALLSKHAYGRK